MYTSICGFYAYVECCAEWKQLMNQKMFPVINKGNVKKEPYTLPGRGLIVTYCRP